jgi:hypothetical protein
VPELYLKAGGEVLFLLMAFSWVTTLIWNYPVVENNPLLTRLGYNNLCVGFDTIPARYVAQFVFIPSAYFCVRYAWTDLERTEIVKGRLTGGVVTFSWIADILFILSVALFGEVFVMPPNQTPEASESSMVWMHSCMFLQYIFIRFVVVLSNVFEAKAVSTASWIFTGVYGFVSVVFPACVVINYIWYDMGYRQPLIPWYCTMTVDYIWFLCLPATSVFLPEAEVLVLQTSAMYLDEIDVKTEDAVTADAVTADEATPLVGTANKQKSGACGCF